MRAYYLTHQRIRAFVLGVPEGWHVNLFDLEKRQWSASTNGSIYPTLGEAKAAAEDQVAAALGRKPPLRTKWH
jgi:hypothetical protein